MIASPTEKRYDDSPLPMKEGIKDLAMYVPTETFAPLIIPICYTVSLATDRKEGPGCWAGYARASTYRDVIHVTAYQYCFQADKKKDDAEGNADDCSTWR
jgi:hypothetical protein